MSYAAKAALAHDFQVAAFAPLEDKVVRALVPQQRGWQLPGMDPMSIRSVVCSGGVASNQFLRHRLRCALDKHGRSDVALHFPPLSLCVDNAAMIAWAGAERMALGLTDTMEAPPRARWLLDANAKAPAGHANSRAGY